MKKIAVFGASGRTGKEFVKQALAKGYSIKALVRKKESLAEFAGQLEIIQGDVLQLDDVEKTIFGTDLVVSLFGHVKGSPEWLQTNGTQNIVQAMKKYNIKTIISLSGGGLPFPEKDKPKFIDYLIRGIMKIAVPKVLNDAIAHHQVLEKSGLEWVIVRGPRLTMGDKTGIYRIGWVGVNSGTQISRADLADFVVKQVADFEYPKQMPFVSY